MRLRIASRLAAVALVSALAPAASAQIISTSIPYADRGVAAGGKNANFHVMVAPFAKWKYGEVYIGEPDPGLLVVGSVNATPNSDFLVAAEGAFGLGEGPWSLTVGGWYNKVGQTDYALSGTFLLDDPSLFPFNVGTINVDVGGDLNLYEGHVGIFYKDFGIQAGIVKTSGNIGGTAQNLRVVFTADPTGQETSLGDFDVAVFESDTTDWDVFGVYKRSGERWNASVGAGAYGKQGITSGSPLRNAENKTVFSAFVSANVEVWKGLGIDASFWYIGSTGTIEGELADLGAVDSDSQSRVTVGVGYSF
jgi:hypothetical protein